MPLLRSFLVLATGLLLGCHGTECGEGQRPTSDGGCADIPGGEDVEGYDALPACTLLEPGSRIEVDAGCADGACDGETYDAIVASLGEEGECETLSGFAFCQWQEGGLTSLFTDDDGDAVPDTGATAAGIHLAPPYDGTTEDGLGVGVSMRCWLDVYGWTDEVEYLTIDGAASITELWWPDRGLFVDDFSPAEGEAPDGYADALSLFGIH